MSGRPRRDAPPVEAPSSPCGRLPILARLQRGLEALYRVETRLDVTHFVVDDDERRAAGVARAPREQLLVKEHAEELRLALFLDAAALANLEAHDPAHRLDERNFWDLCLAIEGVSHFIYVALAAAADRPVSALELELQAEVDKFAICLLLVQADGGEPGAQGDAAGLRRRLYDDVRFAEDLDAGERDRYRTANGEARRYTESLARRFVIDGRTGAMLAELRRFYRLGLGAKLGHIARSG